MIVPPKLTLSAMGSVPSELFLLKVSVSLKALKVLRVLYFISVSSASMALDLTKDYSLSALYLSYFNLISNRLISSSLKRISCSRLSIKNLSSYVWQALIFFLLVLLVSFKTL